MFRQGEASIGEYIEEIRECILKKNGIVPDEDKEIFHE